MPVIQINYDLKKHKDYPALFQGIKNLGAWCHALESCWLVYTRLDAVQVRDQLLKVVDNDDALLVTTVSVKDRAAWHNLKPDVSAWLRKYLTPIYA